MAKFVLPWSYYRCFFSCKNWTECHLRFGTRDFFDHQRWEKLHFRGGGLSFLTSWGLSFYRQPRAIGILWWRLVFESGQLVYGLIEVTIIQLSIESFLKLCPSIKTRSMDKKVWPELNKMTNGANRIRNKKILRLVIFLFSFLSIQIINQSCSFQSKLNEKLLFDLTAIKVFFLFVASAVKIFCIEYFNIIFLFITFCIEYFYSFHLCTTNAILIQKVKDLISFFWYMNLFFDFYIFYKKFINSIYICIHLYERM